MIFYLDEFLYGDLKNERFGTLDDERILYSGHKHVISVVLSYKI